MTFELNFQMHETDEVTEEQTTDEQLIDEQIIDEQIIDVSLSENADNVENDESIDNDENVDNDESFENDETPLLLDPSSTSDSCFTVLKSKTWFNLLQICFATGVPIFLVFFVESINGFTITEYQYKYFADEINFNISFKNTSYCYVNHTDPNFEKQIEVQQKSTQFKLLGLLGGLTSMFGVGFVCRLADKYSRCFALRLVLAVYGLGLTGNGLIMFFGLHPYFILVQYPIIGCVGSIFSVVTISSILYGDVLEQQWQILANISADCIVNLAVVVGMLLASGITDNFYFSYLWLVPIIFTGVLMTFVLELVIPKNIHTDRRYSMAVSRANSMANSIATASRRESRSISRNSRRSSNIDFLSEITDFDIPEPTATPLSVVKKHRPHNQHIYIRLLIFAYGLMALTWGRGNIDDLYAFNQPFCMGSSDLGIVVSISSAFSFISYLLLGTLEALQISQKAQTWFYIGALINGVRYLVYVFAKTKSDFYAQSIIGSIFTGNLCPIIRAELTKSVDKDEQASVISACFSVMTICYIGGAILHLEVYKWSVAWFPKLALIMIDLPAGLLLLSTVVWIHVARN